MSSESMPPSNPKSAPDAPTEILFWIKRDDNKLPPRPEMRYSNPIRTRRGQALDEVKKIIHVNCTTFIIVGVHGII